MDIAIRKDAPISIHEQLTTQIAMQIASGLLPPGAKLPSIRALSARLEIHRNTCLSVYRELAANGLIALRHGSGASVMALKTDSPPRAETPPGNTLETLAEFFARQVWQRGYSWEAAANALAAAWQKACGGTRRLVFVDLHPDILPVFKQELEQALKRPVGVLTLAALEENPEQERESHFIVSRYHYQALQACLKRFTADLDRISERITVIDVGSGRQEMVLVRKLPLGSLVALVSASAIILRQAEAVIHAIRGDKVLIRTYLMGQEPLETLHELSRHAKAVFADHLCIARLKNVIAKPPQPIQIIPDHEIARLTALFGLPEGCD